MMFELTKNEVLTMYFVTKQHGYCKRFRHEVERNFPRRELR
jgi:hypothetical protein